MKHVLFGGVTIIMSNYDAATLGAEGMKGRLKFLLKEENMAWGSNENGVEKEGEKSSLNKVQWLELKDR